MRNYCRDVTHYTDENKYYAIGASDKLGIECIIKLN